MFNVHHTLTIARMYIRYCNHRPKTLSRGEVPGGQGEVRQRHESLPGERRREESQEEQSGQGGKPSHPFFDEIHG